LSFFELRIYVNYPSVASRTVFVPIWMAELGDLSWIQQNTQPFVLILPTALWAQWVQHQVWFHGEFKTFGAVTESSFARLAIPQMERRYPLSR
jgi:hypothetical protein